MLSTTIVAMASEVAASDSACLQGGPRSMAFYTVRVVILSAWESYSNSPLSGIGMALGRCIERDSQVAIMVRCPKLGLMWQDREPWMLPLGWQL